MSELLRIAFKYRLAAAIQTYAQHSVGVIYIVILNLPRVLNVRTLSFLV